MPKKPTPPIAAVIGFIDRINRGDIVGLGDLMTQDHQLLLFEEAPVVGKEANIAAWHGYAQMCPDYVIFPHRITERDGLVALLGHTTGSHLGLPDEVEAEETLIWLAEVRDGALGTWRLVEDSAQNRREYGFA